MSGDVALTLGIALAATLALFVWARLIVPRALDSRFRQSLKAFGTAFELRFPIHKGLTDRVRLLCRSVGEEIGLPEGRLRNLETAAQMRDVGLCAMPYRLGDGKPYEQWAPAERAAYMKHSELSAAMLEYIPKLEALAPIVRQHHLPYRGHVANGSSPNGDLSLEARVLKAVSDFVWFERWQGEALALESIRGGIDTDYDPVVVGAMLAVLTSGGVREHQRRLVESVG